MDIASIIGLLGGLILITTTIVITSDIRAFISVSSFMVTIGGSIASVMVQFPLTDVLKTLKVTKKIFFNKVEDPQKIITILVKLADVSKREGLLALDDKLQNVEDEFLSNGLILAIDGNDPETIEDLMNSEISSMEERHESVHSVFNALGKFAPAFGMIGTLIGLIAMLQTLEDPTSIGVGMAVALITTFYGAFVANLMFIPMAGKLVKRTADEVLHKRLIITGVLSIQMGENPRIIKTKLMTFLPPEQRVSVER